MEDDSLRDKVNVSAHNTGFWSVGCLAVAVVIGMIVTVLLR